MECLRILQQTGQIIEAIFQQRVNCYKEPSPGSGSFAPANAAGTGSGSHIGFISSKF